MSTINGSALATLNRQIVSFTPFQGGEYGGRFEGPLSAIVSTYNLLRSRGYEVHLESDSSPIATCVFRSAFLSSNPGDSATNPNLDYTDTWEIVRNTVQKELLMSDHPSVAALNAQNLLELKQYMQAPDTFEAEDGFTLTGAASFDAANYLFELFRSGVRSVEVKQPILRVTRVTNPLYDATFNVSNVDTLLTTDSMILDSRVPANFAVPLIDLANAVAGTSFDRSDVLVLAFGWLKDMVSSSISGTKRVQYVIEYKFGLWDTVLYGTPA